MTDLLTGENAIVYGGGGDLGGGGARVGIHTAAVRETLTREKMAAVSGGEGPTPGPSSPASRR